MIPCMGRPACLPNRPPVTPREHESLSREIQSTKSVIPSAATLALQSTASLWDAYTVGISTTTSNLSAAGVKQSGLILQTEDQPTQILCRNGSYLVASNPTAIKLESVPNPVKVVAVTGPDTVAQ